VPYPLLRLPCVAIVTLTSSKSRFWSDSRISTKAVPPGLFVSLESSTKTRQRPSSASSSLTTTSRGTPYIRPRAWGAISSTRETVEPNAGFGR
jgi:hypothetical protein